jgi:hypothetical protein
VDLADQLSPIQEFALPDGFIEERGGDGSSCSSAGVLVGEEIALG